VAIARGTIGARNDGHSRCWVSVGGNDLKNCWFGVVDYENMMRLVVVAVTVLAAGMQNRLGGVIVSLMYIESKR
jgi:hypothetical protein